MPPAPDQLAAVDLGSNSFHMVVAHVEEGRLRLVDRLRSRTALAAGLDRHGHLDAAARTRATECLEQFAQRLRGVPRSRIRVVGTNTFRKIRDEADFLRECESAIGRSIEILGGAEEARLVFLGVRYDIGPTDQPLLAVDIGGGSTELALGRGDSPELAESVQIGCVALTARHFKDGRITDKRIRRAMLDARLELEPVEARFANRDVDVVASSGTALAIEAIGQAAGWWDCGVTRHGLKRMRASFVEAGHADRLKLEALSDGRRGVIGVRRARRRVDSYEPRCPSRRRAR